MSWLSVATGLLIVVLGAVLVWRSRQLGLSALTSPSQSARGAVKHVAERQDASKPNRIPIGPLARDPRDSSFQTITKRFAPRAS